MSATLGSPIRALVQVPVSLFLTQLHTDVLEKTVEDVSNGEDLTEENWLLAPDFGLAQIRTMGIWGKGVGTS